MQHKRSIHEVAGNEKRDPPERVPFHFQLSVGGDRSQQSPRLMNPVYVSKVTTSTSSAVLDIRNTLSLPRMQTFDNAATSDAGAVELYRWNAEISAAFMFPLHIAEVSVRNAVSEAVSHVYGSAWPWANGFRRSLPQPPGGYKPARDLSNAANRESTTGKVIPELKFVFWQTMFTARHDSRIWSQQIIGLFPHCSTTTAPALRQRLYNDLDQIRTLRNRIAHHEPIFSRALGDDLAAITDLVRIRSTDTANWLAAHETVSELLTKRPT